NSIVANATPLVIAGIGETITERAGVVNLSVNGTLLLSAMTGFAAAVAANSTVAGILAAALTGAVHGRLVSLESALATGDVVEVFTSKSADAGPSRDWLGFVKSPRARNKIRQWFSKERREEALERGKEELAKALRRQDLPMRRLLTHDTLATIASELNLGSIDALYTSIGEGHTGAQHVVEKLRASFGGADGAEEDLAEITLPSKVRPRGSRAERHTAET